MSAAASSLEDRILGNDEGLERHPDVVIPQVAVDFATLARVGQPPSRAQCRQWVSDLMWDLLRAVLTGSCAGSETTTVKCDATTKGVEARVLDVTGVELKPLAALQETGAVQGRTATLSADAVTLTLAGEVGCGADKLVNATVTTYVCE